VGAVVLVAGNGVGVGLSPLRQAARAKRTRKRLMGHDFFIRNVPLAWPMTLLYTLREI
jgi:hypothetical protein